MPYAGGVVGLDVVGAVQLQLDAGDVFGAVGAVQVQGGGDGVGEGVGEHAVDDVAAVERAVSGPGGAGVVVLVARPGPGRADAADLADGAVGDELADRGAAAWEPSDWKPIWQAVPGRAGLGHPGELGVGGRGGLLQQQVRAASGGGEGEVGVGVDRGADDGDPGARARHEAGEVAGLLGGRRGRRRALRRSAGVSSQTPASRTRPWAANRRMLSRCQCPWPRAPASTRGVGSRAASSRSVRRPRRAPRPWPPGWRRRSGRAERGSSPRRGPGRARCRSCRSCGWPAGRRGSR